jgi:PAS domain S-box-containing protein
LKSDSLNSELPGGQLGFAILGLMLTLLPNGWGYRMKADPEKLADSVHLKKRSSPAEYRSHMIRFFRFSPSRLALGYIALSVLVLALFAIPLWYAWRVNISTFRAYVQGEDMQKLVDIFDREGAKALVTAMELQVRSLPGDQIMVLADRSKLRLAGNLPAWPAEVPDAPGTYGLVIGLGGGSSMRVVASHVRLRGGYHLLMGRESVRFESLVERFWYGIAGVMGIVLVLGAVIGWLIHRALLSEVDEISRTASAIVRGDLSRRVTARGRSDELDTLARTVNGMLEQLARQNVQLEGEIDVRRQAEQALHRAHDNLEGLVAERTVQLARANESLRRSETYLAEAQRLSLTGSFGWNVITGELFWSQETFCIMGYDRGTKPTLQLVLNRIHPEDLGLVQQTLDRASRDLTDMDFEHRLLFPDGSVKHVHVMARAVKDESGTLEFVGAVSDVTAKKLADEKIRQNEREFREIVEAIPQLITVLAPDGDTLYVNRPVLQFTGLSLDEIQAGALREKVIHSDDLQRVREEIQQTLACGIPFETEYRVLGKDGRHRWFLNRFNPLLDEQGQVIRWYVTGIDIDDRKQAEERVHKENLALREEIDHSSMFEEIVGSSEELHTVLGQVAKVAPTDSTVLIQGETGTGKELIARAIHKRSKRSARAFIRVNCAAIPQSLIASELFGHEKGAFTGALQRRLGRFELADGGTIFLDEIGELPGETQIALLRVLQEREFERVGGGQPIPVDVRVLAATNRDLKAAVAAGVFRQDLFYRLNVFPIQMPSLRERRDDIHLLVEYFIERYGKTAGKKFRNINKKTLELFQAYDWPGNIRELQNVIERAVILCDGDTFSVDETWLKRESPQVHGPAVPFVGTLLIQEKEMIESALAQSHGRIAGPVGAAAKLGIPRQTLESKIRRLGIDAHRFRTRQAN